MASLSGGKKFDAAMLKLAAAVRNPGTLRVGFLSKAKYPDGTPVAMIAAIQDFGAPRASIPPRPFFRNMIAEKRAEWPKAVADLLRIHDGDTAKTLALMGDAIQSQLKQSIQDTNSPPLKPATIRRKGFDKPLIDTGDMWRSVDYEVVT